jgi:hypothetical protein
LVRGERNVVLTVCGVVLLVIVGVSFLAPPSDDSDRTPNTYNSGSAGAKAAYLLLGELGYDSQRWDQPPSALSTVDADHTTVIFAEPMVPAERLQSMRSDVSGFLNRGGRVLMIGDNGAMLLPNAAIKPSTQPLEKLCISTPEGRSAIAGAGAVSIADYARWDAQAPAVHVEQWCGGDAVVVSYRAGAGTVVWWSSALPLTNAGLKNDSSLKLLLASIGDVGSQPRTVLFDEYLHGPTSVFDLTGGLPIKPIGYQLALVAILLIISFSRRRGPVRELARLPRTSPIEFAESMGQLYRKAGATQAATESARMRVIEFLRDRCGFTREMAQADGGTMAEAIQSRFPGDWSGLAEHLTQASEARYRGLAPKSALALVNALNDDIQSLSDQTIRPEHTQLHNQRGINT